MDEWMCTFCLLQAATYTQEREREIRDDAGAAAWGRGTRRWC
jgi:hypothetical protein